MATKGVTLPSNLIVAAGIVVLAIVLMLAMLLFIELFYSMGTIP